MGNILERLARSLIGIEDFLDGQSNVVLGIAKFNFQVGLTLHLDLDEIAEIEYLILVTILDQDIEVGVDHRCLILAGELEGHRLDIVLFVCLLLQFRMLLGIDEFHTHPALRGDRVLLQQVAQARHQWRQQWMSLSAEIAADQQRFLQLHQVASGGV